MFDNLPSVTFVLVLGLLGNAISFGLWIPQAVSTYRVRNDDAALAVLSPWTQLLVVANAIVWGLYAVATGYPLVGAPGLVNGPLAAITAGLVFGARARLRQSPAPLLCGCGQASADVPHDFVVTAPPGYGTVDSPCVGVNSWGYAVPLGTGAEHSARMRASSIL